MLSPRQPWHQGTIGATRPELIPETVTSDVYYLDDPEVNLADLVAKPLPEVPPPDADAWRATASGGGPLAHPHGYPYAPHPPLRAIGALPAAFPGGIAQRAPPDL